MRKKRYQQLRDELIREASVMFSRMAVEKVGMLVKTHLHELLGSGHTVIICDDSYEKMDERAQERFLEWFQAAPFPVHFYMHNNPLAGRADSEESSETPARSTDTE